ncbi:hypothetical protein EBESD8_11410 [Rhodococcus aetherivorans]|nr:hypothetical protein EBESD8_11410 [Rhodococcus aetherivorans]
MDRHEGRGVQLLGRKNLAGAQRRREFSGPSGRAAPRGCAQRTAGQNRKARRAHQALVQGGAQRSSTRCAPQAHHGPRRPIEGRHRCAQRDRGRGCPCASVRPSPYCLRRGAGRGGAGGAAGRTPLPRPMPVPLGCPDR